MVSRTSSKAVLILSTALTLTLAAGPSHADPALPGLGNNLNFETYTGAAPKNTFQSVNPTGWTGGAGLIFIAGTGPGQDATNGPNATYQAPSDISSTIGPYNYVQADGNPIFESSFSFATVKGLTPGTQYALDFYQAASQQQGFGGATTNQWIVALGASGSSLFSASASNPTVPNQNCGTHCVYTDTDPTASVGASTLMNVPSQGLVDWQQTAVFLTAQAATETLSFLAWGDNGNTTNLPPMAFLTGVNSFVAPPPPSIAEPASIALVGAGLVGIGGIVRRRRRAQTSTK